MMAKFLRRSGLDITEGLSSHRQQLGGKRLTDRMPMAGN
jgi:hypothetical protein